MLIHFFTRLFLAASLIINISFAEVVKINPVVNPVIDEAHLLSESFLTALNQVLLEHEQATHERILVLTISNEASKSIENPSVWINEIINQTGVSNRGRSQGAALVYFEDSKKAYLEIFMGVEGKSSATLIESLLNTYFYPELEEDSGNRAFSLAVLSILRELKSPLIENNRVEKILKSAGFEGTFTTQNQPAKTSKLLPAVVLIALFLLFIVIWRSLQLERYFSTTGIHHTYPKLFKQKNRFKGGGSVGNW